MVVIEQGMIQSFVWQPLLSSVYLVKTVALQTFS